jgi:hypothetical protein
MVVTASNSSVMKARSGSLNPTDPLDIVLTADESFALKKHGLAIVSACGGPAAIAVRIE